MSAPRDLRGEMSPDELDSSIPIPRYDEDIESMEPKTQDRNMVKQDYSPISVSLGRGRDLRDGNKNTISGSLSGTSSSAFNAHSPPYLKKRRGDDRTDQDTEDYMDGAFTKSRDRRNLDMDDIIDSPNFSKGGAPGMGGVKSAYDLKASGVSAISGDSSSQL